MFKNKRESFVNNEVARLTESFFAEQCEIDLDPKKITAFLKAAREMVHSLDLETHAHFEATLDQDSPSYLLHVLEHGYHIGQINERIDLVEDLLESKLIPRAYYEVSDKLVGLRILGYMSYVDAQVVAMQRQIF